MMKPRSALAVRRIFRDQILYSNAAWDSVAWTTYCKDLRHALGLSEAAATSNSVLVDLFSFVDGEALKMAAKSDRSTKEALYSDFAVKLGSVHSVKGKTVDAILVVEFGNLERLFKSRATDGPSNRPSARFRS